MAIVLPGFQSLRSRHEEGEKEKGKMSFSYCSFGFLISKKDSPLRLLPTSHWSELGYTVILSFKRS